jgi:glycosyltransferase involved in cell wall biosynthesis
MMDEQKHLLHVFSTFAVGGPQVRTCEIINSLDVRFRHTIIALDGNYQCREKLKETGDVRFREIQVDKGSLARCVRQFRNLLKEIRPDLLLTYNFGAVEWGLANSVLGICRHLHHEDGFGPEEQQQQLRRRVLVRRLFLRKIERLIVPSKRLEEIAVRSWKFPRDVIAYIPNGVDCHHYARGASRHSRKDDLVIGTVATLRREKNIPRLIRIFRRLIEKTEIRNLNPRLVIAGNGPEYQEITRIVQENNVDGRIELIGYVPDPAQVFRDFDIFAITSDTEQMPLSVLEAMAAACPVAGMDVGDIKSMLSRENQTLISPAGDELHLEGVLENLLLDAELRKTLGHRNQEVCGERFDKHLMFARYEKLYAGNR